MAAAALVEKATSDLLIGPDWAMNMDICDHINADPGQARDVIKAVKKRLGNKNAKVQLLALTVLETMVKNCSEIVHQQVAEKDVLHEMVKIVRKKTDMQVRDKILVMIDSWQEAFGGPGGRYPQYFLAFDDLRRSGVEFPVRAAEGAVPIFTPPQTQPITAYRPQGYVSPRLGAVQGGDVALPTETTMSLSDIETARGGMDLLSEMLNAIDPPSREAVKEELIVDLVEQCRLSQRRVEHLVNTTSDEELLRRGLALNDDLQQVMVKHDAIASGSPLPRDFSNATAPPVPHGRRFDHEEEEGEDDFSQLAHRSSRPRSQSHSSEQARPTSQLALPPPPPGRKLSTTPSQREMTVDLLSGDTYHQSRPQPVPPQIVLNPNYAHSPPAIASPISSTALVPHQFTGQQSGNPFATPPFQAASSAQAVVYGSPPQQQQQFHSNGGVGGQQPPQPKYTYAQYQQQQQAQQNQQHYQGATGQSPAAATSGGYVASWSGVSPSGSPLSPPGGYTGASAWGATMNPQQRALLYGNNAAVSPIPPPPGQHVLRQQYFQQQQAALNPDPYQRQTQALSSQDVVQYGQQPGYGQQTSTAPPQPSTPTKEFKPADKLFEDLVDLQSVNAKLKATAISGTVARPSTSKAGGQ